MFRIVETLTKISLPLNASIGAGLRIYDLGMIFIHSDSIIGRNCTIRHGVTVGNTKEDGRVPVIGDHVKLGAYAQILGGVHIGDGAKVGPLSVVLTMFPQARLQWYSSPDITGCLGESNGFQCAMRVKRERHGKTFVLAH